MATPPTFVAAYQSAWNTTTTPKTTAGTFNASTGDVLVSGVPDEQDNGTENYAWSNTGGAATWTELTETSGGTNADVWLQTARTVLTAPISAGAVSVARSAGTAEFFGLVVAHFTNTLGVGATVTQAGTGTAAASLSITTTADNSALFAIFSDFSAADGTSRAWRAVNGFTPTAANTQELTYFRDSLHYTVYAAYWPDAGTAGAKTVGLTTPTGDFLGAAIEVLGTAGAAPQVPILVMAPRQF